MSNIIHVSLKYYSENATENEIYKKIQIFCNIINKNIIKKKNNIKKFYKRTSVSEEKMILKCPKICYLQRKC